MANSLDSAHFLLPAVYQAPESENQILPPYGSTLPVSQTPAQQVTKQQSMAPQTASNDVVEFAKYLNSYGGVTTKPRHHMNPSDPATQISQGSIYTDISGSSV